MTETDEINYAIRPNKTQIKREIKQLREMVKVFLELPETRLKKILNDVRLLEAVQLAKRLKKAALQRQIRLIVKLLQNENVEQIQADLQRLANSQPKKISQQSKQITQWVEALLQGDNLLSQKIISAYPDIDRQHFNQLVRQVKKVESEQKKAIAQRKLHQFLHDAFTFIQKNMD